MPRLAPSRVTVAFCLVVLPLVAACYSLEQEGMQLQSPTEGLVVGDTVTMTVMGRDSTVPTAVRWESSDRTIATVDGDGVITAVGPGVARIRAYTLDYRLELPLLVWATAGPFEVIGIGVDHACALADDGTAWCWGSNEEGQLGTRFTPDYCLFTRNEYLLCSRSALPVGTNLIFTGLAAGFYHTCALSPDGTAWCWGANDGGQLGGDDSGSRPTPAPVVGEEPFASLTAGGRTTCGLTSPGALWCWGTLPVPEEGKAVRVSGPTPVAPELRFRVVDTSGEHSCGIDGSGATWCWGLNRSGELGASPGDCDGTPCIERPLKVSTAPPLVDLALGRGYSCGLTAGGEAWCWGENARGQLGDGTRVPRSVPAPVSGGHRFSRLAADRDRACGLDLEGRLLCWGRDGSDFGNGGGERETDVPLLAAGDLTFSEIEMGLNSQCGVQASGLTWCWGANLYGALGNGRSSREAVTTPVRVVRHPVRGGG